MKPTWLILYLYLDIKLLCFTQLSAGKPTGKVLLTESVIVFVGLECERIDNRKVLEAQDCPIIEISQDSDDRNYNLGEIFH